MKDILLEKQLVHIQSTLDKELESLKNKLLENKVPVEIVNEILENTETNFFDSLNSEEDVNRIKDRHEPTLYRRMIFITLLEIKIIELKKALQQ